MDAIQVTRPDGYPAGHWKCGLCHQDKFTDQPSAEACCKTACLRCGGPTVVFNPRCKACCEILKREREAERFAAAEKLTAWGGWVWTEAIPHNDGFFESIESLIEFCNEEVDYEGNPYVLPEYVYTSYPRRFVRVSFDSILDDITNEAFEDFGEIHLRGVTEFKEAIKAFNEANKSVTAYEANRKQVVILQPKPTN